MEQITLRIPQETLESLESEAEEHGVSRSEHIRTVLESRNEHEENTAELRSEIDDLETTVERLQNEKRMLLEQTDEHSQLVRYVESEQSYREASLPQRLKWWVFGRDRAE
jgi:metal-responsive CopG/Arc/MetJ family transcriptional regulator